MLSGVQSEKGNPSRLDNVGVLVSQERPYTRFATRVYNRRECALVDDESVVPYPIADRVDSYHQGLEYRGRLVFNNRIDLTAQIGDATYA